MEWCSFFLLLAETQMTGTKGFELFGAKIKDGKRIATGYSKNSNPRAQSTSLVLRKGN